MSPIAAAAAGPARPSSLAPVWRRPDGWLVAGALALGYGLSGTADLWWFDSAELALTAVQDGVSHPPGQPLYTLVAHGLSRLTPWPLLGVALASWLPGALAALAALALVERLVGPPADRAARLLRSLLLLAAGLSSPLWEPASRIEVYALATSLLLGQQVLLLGALAGDGRGAGAGPRRAWALTGLASGLLCCANLLLGAVATLTAGLAGLGWALGRQGRVGSGPQAVRRRGALAAAGVGFAVGLLPQLQLLWAASRGDGRWVWGNLLQPAGLLDFLRGADYAFGPRALPVPRWLAQLWALGGHYLQRPGFAVLALGLPCLGLLLLRRPRAWVLALPAAALFAIQAANRPLLLDNPDYLGYLAPGGWLLAVALAALATAGVRREPAGEGARPVRGGAAPEGRAAAAGAVGSRRRWPLLAGGLLACGLVLAPPVPWARGRAGEVRPRALARAALRETPADGLLLLSSDHLVFPALYLQRVERLRPDVVLLPWGLSDSSWLFADLARQHPGLRPAPRAPDRRSRLAGLLAANPERPLAAEHEALARALLPATRPLRAGALLVHAAPRTPGGRASQLPVASLRALLLPLLAAGQGPREPLGQEVVAATVRSLVTGALALGDGPWALTALAAAAPAGPWTALARAWPAAQALGTPPGSCWGGLLPPSTGPSFLHHPGCLVADLGYLFWAGGAVEPALQTLHEAVAAGACLDAALPEADLLLALGRTDQAARTLASYRAQGGSLAAAGYFEAELRRRRGDLAGALAQLERLAADPEFGDPARQRAALLRGTLPAVPLR